MSAQNKAAMQRLFEEGWSQGKYDLIHELLSPDYVGHMVPPTFPAGPEGFCQYIQLYRTALPDLHIQVDDMIAGEGKVVSRLTIRGTQNGPLMQFPPSHKKVAVSAIVIARFENGQNVEMWGEYDTLGLMQQIGAIPVV